jgi:hypothetical protein
VQKKKPRPLTKDALQDQEINGLKQELASVHRLLGMLLVLVDPVDVQAALRLKTRVPRNSELRKLAQQSDSPPEHFDDDDERPW